MFFFISVLIVEIIKTSTISWPSKFLKFVQWVFSQISSNWAMSLLQHSLAKLRALGLQIIVSLLIIVYVFWDVLCKKSKKKSVDQKWPNLGFSQLFEFCVGASRKWINIFKRILNLRKNVYLCVSENFWSRFEGL